MIDAYIDSLSLQEDQLFSSKEVLKQHGNMSSATVLYVIKHYLVHQSAEAGIWGFAERLALAFPQSYCL